MSEVQFKLNNLYTFIDLYAFTKLSRQQILERIESGSNNEESYINELLRRFYYSETKNITEEEKHEILKYIFPSNELKTFMNILNNMKKFGKVHLIDQLKPLSSPNALIVCNRFVDEFKLFSFQTEEVLCTRPSMNIYVNISRSIQTPNNMEEIGQNNLLNVTNVFYITCETNINDYIEINNMKIEPIIIKNFNLRLITLLQEKIEIFEPSIPSKGFFTKGFFTKRNKLNGYYLLYNKNRQITLDELLECVEILKTLFTESNSNNAYTYNSSINSYNKSVIIKLENECINILHINANIKNKRTIEGVIDVRIKNIVMNMISNDSNEITITGRLEPLRMEYHQKKDENEYNIDDFNFIKEKYKKNPRMLNLLNRIKEYFPGYLQMKYNISYEQLRNLYENVELFNISNNRNSISGLAENIISNDNNYQLFQLYCLINDYLGIVDSNILNKIWQYIHIKYKLIQIIKINYRIIINKIDSIQKPRDCTQDTFDNIISLMKEIIDQYDDDRNFKLLIQNIRDSQLNRRIFQLITRYNKSWRIFSDDYINLIQNKIITSVQGGSYIKKRVSGAKKRVSKH